MQARKAVRWNPKSDGKGIRQQKAAPEEIVRANVVSQGQHVASDKRHMQQVVNIYGTYRRLDAQQERGHCKRRNKKRYRERGKVGEGGRGRMGWGKEEAREICVGERRERRERKEESVLGVDRKKKKVIKGGQRPRAHENNNERGTALLCAVQPSAPGCVHCSTINPSLVVRSHPSHPH